MLSVVCGESVLSVRRFTLKLCWDCAGDSLTLRHSLLMAHLVSRAVCIATQPTQVTRILSAHHQFSVRLYIQCLANVFQKHKLNICAPTRINPVNRFGETMFRYTHARLAENERTRCLLTKAYIRVRLSHFRDEAYTHFTLGSLHASLRVIGKTAGSSTMRIRRQSS